jgi:hypothetical protein
VPTVQKFLEFQRPGSISACRGLYRVSSTRVQTEPTVAFRFKSQYYYLLTTTRRSTTVQKVRILVFYGHSRYAKARHFYFVRSTPRLSWTPLYLCPAAATSLQLRIIFMHTCVRANLLIRWDRYILLIKENGYMYKVFSCYTINNFT